MAPSLSAVERGNPPPRRKSAKRRCDLRQPSCLRCSQRKIDCSYPTHVENLSRKRNDTDPSSTEVGSNARPQELLKDPLLEMSCWDTGFDFNMDMSPSYTSTCSSFPTLSFDEPTLPGLEFLNDVVNLDSTLSPVSPTPGPSLELEDPMPVVVRSPKSQLASLTRIQLLRAASELIEKRLGYSVDAFKRAPESMLLEGGTPWSHPALYRDSMPGCLEDALGAYALYRAKNSANAAMIQRVIELRYQKLLTAPAPTTSASEIMARSHALILYQIMLFFDDSLPAHTLAEETVSALGDSAMALMEFARHEEEDDDDSVSNPSRRIPLYPLTAARALYSDWTFQESLRRTLLISFLFTQLQCLMRADFSNFMSPTYAPSGAGPTVSLTTPSCVDLSTLAAIKHALQQSPYVDDSKCDARMLMCRSLTLSAHLWNSRDPVEFAVAWRDKKHLVVQPSNIWKQIDVAQPDDIDQFGRILMTSGMGIEETKGWFTAKGGRL
ncbi:hypothetical protein FHL15_004763 [Xylaria flabelliformis]|uniref:Zn(2)-C6 fungal-type domain-containing protein n=1 Tax=Xylaria flabelliformis TaxID=2512241 RepID=A0A553I275_9PEZI|nr:hypothetical protein FHL15_004763 [Xylaria flabelliformis]